jgi:hypothetical protein
MGWGYQVESRDEVFRAISRVGTLEAGRRYVWRGTASRHFSVRSSLLRDLAGPDGPVPREADVRAREREILAVTRGWGIGIEQGIVATDLHLLALLQHHVSRRAYLMSQAIRQPPFGLHANELTEHTMPLGSSLRLM